MHLALTGMEYSGILNTEAPLKLVCMQVGMFPLGGVRQNAQAGAEGRSQVECGQTLPWFELVPSDLQVSFHFVTWRVALAGSAQLSSHLQSPCVPSDSQIMAGQHNNCNVGGARSDSGHWWSAEFAATLDVSTRQWLSTHCDWRKYQPHAAELNAAATPVSPSSRSLASSQLFANYDDRL